ncbi:Cytidylate kinase [uncultured archaeon]|nr:Cytidylate kinase [uncultured archaeon]
MKTIIGIIGPIASGKDTVADYISKKLGMPIFQTSSVLREIARQRNIPETRKDLILLSRELAAEFGKDYLVKSLLQKAENNCIITGMREIGQIEYLRKNTKFILISVNADVKTRFERLKSRHHIDEGKTFEEFLANEKEEDTKNNVQRLSECMKFADYKIENNSDLDSLFRKTDGILAKIMI